MLRFVLGQIVVTLVTAAIFLAVFSAFDVWGKPLDARIAAMAVATGLRYLMILFNRLIVKNREMDRHQDVTLAAAV